MFTGWTVAFLEPTFAKKKLEILKKAFESNGGKTVNLSTCDYKKMTLFENDSKHVILADAQINQDLSIIFRDCSSFKLENIRFYSSNWISDSIRAGILADLGNYKLHSFENSSPKKKPRTFDDGKDYIHREVLVINSYDCFRPTPLDHHNKGLVQELSTIAHYRYLTGNFRSELSYNKAISVLKFYPKEIESAEEAEKLPGIGPKIFGLIAEYLETGKIQAAEDAKSSEEYQALDKLTKIHGVGPKTAQLWYQLGLKSAGDLQDAVNNGEILLKEDQAIGLKYFEDFNIGMSRVEVEEILNIVKSASNKLFGDVVIVEMTGGYRRGKKINGDADILIHTKALRPSKSTILDNLIKELQPKHIKAILSVSRAPKSKPKNPDGLDICLMAFQVAPDQPMRRVDFIVSSSHAYPFAMLGWTGSRQFERSIRLYAHKEVGVTLTDHGIVGKASESLEFQDERDIFEFLGVPHLDPTLRNC